MNARRAMTRTAKRFTHMTRTVNHRVFHLWLRHREQFFAHRALDADGWVCAQGKGKWRNTYRGIIGGVVLVGSARGNLR